LVLVCCLIPATAVAGEIGADCTTENNGGFRTVTVELWNPGTADSSFEVTLEVRAGQATWRSPVVSGRLAAGQRISRTFRPFERGVAISACTVLPSGAAAGVAPGASPQMVGTDTRTKPTNHLTRGVAAYLAGLGAGFVGGLSGALIGSRAFCDGCDDNLAGLVIGAYAGYVIGFPVGFAIAANHDGSNNALGWTILGSFAGAGITVLSATQAHDLDSMWLPALLLPQAGAVASFYLNHRHTTPPSPTPSALLELRDGHLTAGIPFVSRQPMGTRTITTISLLAGAF
jgi:hypothetical protein